MGENYYRKAQRWIRKVMTYGVATETVYNGETRYLRLSSGYTLEKAQQRCNELNRIQWPKNTKKLYVVYFVSQDSNE